MKPLIKTVVKLIHDDELECLKAFAETLWNVSHYKITGEIEHAMHLANHYIDKRDELKQLALKDSHTRGDERGSGVSTEFPWFRYEINHDGIFPAAILSEITVSEELLDPDSFGVKY